MQKLNIIYVVTLLTIIFVTGVCRADNLPSWLSGKPDQNIVKERSALYKWVIHQADKQTNGQASQQTLAKNRLINLSNKLAVHFEKSDQNEFSAKLIYLVIGAEQPMHFNFYIQKEKLNELLNK